VWWIQNKDDHPKSSPHSVLAFQTNAYIKKNQRLLVYANPNCNHYRHTIEVCYWPGRGKEGQFSPGFGQRRGTKSTAVNTKQGTLQQIPIANIAEEDTCKDFEV